MQVSVKRLRISGKFVTKKQAFQILGVNEEELLSNGDIQKLLTMHAGHQQRVKSIIQNSRDGGKILKVHNFQALYDSNYNLHPSTSENTPANVPDSPVPDHNSESQVLQFVMNETQ